MREGDWNCAECDSHNYNARVTCFRCTLPKERSEVMKKGKAALDWECFQCRERNYGWRAECYRCRIPRFESEELKAREIGVEWFCKFCDLTNFPKRFECFKCRRPREECDRDRAPQRGGFDRGDPRGRSPPRGGFPQRDRSPPRGRSPPRFGGPPRGRSPMRGEGLPRDRSPPRFGGPPRGRSPVRGGAPPRGRSPMRGGVPPRDGVPPIHMRRPSPPAPRRPSPHRRHNMSPPRRPIISPPRRAMSPPKRPMLSPPRRPMSPPRRPMSPPRRAMSPSRRPPQRMTAPVSTTPQKRMDPPQLNQDVEWNCELCSTSNGFRRDHCYKCATPKGSGPLVRGAPKRNRSPVRGNRPSPRDQNRPGRSRDDAHRGGSSSGHVNSGPSLLGQVFGTQSNNREGSWDCNNCLINNFSFRKECFKCKTPKPKDSRNQPNLKTILNHSSSKGPILSTPKPDLDYYEPESPPKRRRVDESAEDEVRMKYGPDWMCRFCKVEIFPTRTDCYKCGRGKEECEEVVVQAPLMSTPVAPTRNKSRDRSWVAREERGTGGSGWGGAVRQQDPAGPSSSGYRDPGPVHQSNSDHQQQGPSHQPQSRPPRHQDQPRYQDPPHRQDPPRQTVQSGPLPNVDWNCGECRINNYHYRHNCFKCRRPRSEVEDRAGWVERREDRRGLLFKFEVVIFSSEW